ncbi:hypothetical protein Q5752_001884 [Cryptotrichosporon argae]
MASQRFIPYMVAATVGVAGGMYIWNAPLQDITGKAPPTGTPAEGRSQSVRDGSGGPAAQPHAPLKYGGAAPSKGSDATVAGTTPESRKTYSADRDIKTRENPNVHDGTGGGGVGVKEMRERKEAGQGLPSKQGGDSKAKPAEAVAYDGEGSGVKKPKNGRWWLGGW